MNLKRLLAGFLMLLAAGEMYAEELSSETRTPEKIGSKMLVEPSSTTVAMGKANLSVSPLIHEGKAYTGDYQLKVTPYFFKSEKGTLLLVATDETVRKLTGGKEVEFTGKATNSDDGVTKVVTGKATPTAKDRGTVTFWVDTENGKMEFNTSYSFVE